MTTLQERLAALRSSPNALNIGAEIGAMGQPKSSVTGTVTTAGSRQTGTTTGGKQTVGQIGSAGQPKIPAVGTQRSTTAKNAVNTLLNSPNAANIGGAIGRMDQVAQAQREAKVNSIVSAIKNSPGAATNGGAIGRIDQIQSKTTRTGAEFGRQIGTMGTGIDSILSRIVERYGGTEENGEVFFASEEGANAYNTALSDYLRGQNDTAISNIQKQIDEKDARIAELQTLANEWVASNPLYLSVPADQLNIQPVGGYGSLEEITDEIARLKSEQIDLAGSNYYRDMSSQKARLTMDEQGAAGFRSADKLQTDMNKVSAVMEYDLGGGAWLTGTDGELVQMDDTSYREVMDYLSETYGVTERSADLYQLYNRLYEQFESTTAELDAQGYNYARVNKYDARLAREAEARAQEEKWRQQAEEDPVGQALLARGVGLLRGMDYLGSLFTSEGGSDPTDLATYAPPTTADMYATRWAGTIDDTVVQKIRDSVDDETWEKIATFSYQTGMSVVDSALATALFGKASIFVLGSSAAAQQTKDIIERGGTREQALWGGAAAGVAEAVFEKFSVDNLLSAKSITGFKSMVVETLKQGGVEATEEMATEIANIMFDAAIMGEKSEFNQMVQRYMSEEGLSREAATEKAYMDMIDRVVLAGIGGLVSGEVMGGAFNAAQYRPGQTNEKNNTAATKEASHEAYTVKRDSGGDVYVQINADILNGVPESEWKSTVRNIIQKIFGDGINLPRGTVLSNRKGRGEYSNGSYTRMLERTDPEMYADKLRMAAGADGLISNASNVKYEDASHERTDDIVGFNRGNIVVSVKGNGYQGDVLTAIYSDGKETFFDINNLARKNIEATSPERYAAQGGFTQAGNVASKGDSPPSTVGRHATSIKSGGSPSSITIIPQTSQEINSPSQADIDSIVRQLTEEQQRSEAEASGQRDAASADYSDAAPGLVQNEYSERLDQSTAKVLDLLGKAAGTPVVVEAQVRGGTANGSYQNGVVRIAADAENPAIAVGKHEITHRMQELAPKEYKAYRDYAVRVLSAGKTDLVQRYQNNAAAQGERLTYEQALDEIAADFTEMLLTDEARLEQFLIEAIAQSETRTMVQKFFDAVREFINKVRSVFNSERAKMDAATREQFGVSLRQLEQAEKRWMELVQASVRAEKNTAESGGGVQYDLKDRIAVGMSEDDRYQRLKGKTLSIPHYDAAKVETIEDGGYEALEQAGRSSAFKLLRKIGEQFGVFKDYRNVDMEIDFAFSRRNLQESLNKQGGEYQHYAQMMSVFDDVVEGAIGTEAHTNRYEEKGSQIAVTYVFSSAFATDESIVPVLLEVREYTDGTSNSLYVAVSLHEIEKSRIVVYNNTNVSDGAPYTLPAFTARIADLFANVNKEDGRMLKYIPDGFLNEDQRAAKQVALAEQEEYVRRKNAGRQQNSLKGQSELMRQAAKHKADIDFIVQQLTEEQQRSQEAAIEQMAAELRGVRKEEIDPFLLGFNDAPGENGAGASPGTENAANDPFLVGFNGGSWNAPGHGGMANSQRNGLIALGNDAIIVSKIDKFKEDLQNGKINTAISKQKQARHMYNSKEYNMYVTKLAQFGDFPSYIREDLTMDALSELIKDKLGTGIIEVKDDNSIQEFFDCDDIVGYWYDKGAGEFVATKRVQIKYSLGKGNIHIIPVKEVY